jgi:hypothetical protein
MTRRIATDLALDSCVAGQGDFRIGDDRTTWIFHNSRDLSRRGGLRSRPANGE